MKANPFSFQEAMVRLATYGVHLEVDKLSPREGDDDLPAVDGAPVDRLLARRAPLVDALVRPDVTDAVGVYLDKEDICFKIMGALEQQQQNF